MTFFTENKEKLMVFNDVSSNKLLADNKDNCVIFLLLLQRQNDDTVSIK